MITRQMPAPVAIETMIESVKSQAPLIPAVLRHTEQQVERAADAIAADVDTLFLSGCGDSLYAALASRLAFEKYSGIRVEPIEALEFSRYTVQSLPQRAAVVAISAGGDKSRTIEALLQAKKRGATTIALTGVAESPLASNAAHAIVHNERELRPRPATSSGVFALGNYLASMLVLYDLAFRIGIARGTLSPDARNAAMAEIHRASAIITATVSAVQDSLMEFAASVSSAPAFYILGGGPSYATALFGAAKLFEMPQLQGVPVELEEWAHEQYFLTRSGSVCLVIAPPGASVDRAREQMEGAAEMGARTVAICDRNDTATAALAEVHFDIAGELSEEYSPLIYCVPLELLAVGLCRALERPAFGFINQTQFDVNMRQIASSQIRD